MSGFDDLIIEEQEDAIVEEMEKHQRVEPIRNHIAFVMDHSGSVSNLADVMRTNFNEQLAQIRKDSGEQENYVTLIEFDSEIKTRCRNKHIDAIKNLDEYWIGGMTALYDSVMLAINYLETDMPKEGNNAALVVIITDGYENASVENGGDEGRLRLKERIEKLQDTGKWTFVFMGADQDVLETAVSNMGIAVGNTMAFAASTDGVKEASETYAMSYSSYSNSRSNSTLSGYTGTTGFFGSSGNSGNKKRR